MLSFTEENYLKCIFFLAAEKGEQKGISTNDIAKKINISPASVSDMLKKLAKKKLLHYEKYQGVRLTKEGHQKAVLLIRKHRLWETFLYQKLKFNGDEVHEVAEELEHINSPLLTQKLDAFLGFPKFDPHGAPIPDEHGEFRVAPRKLLSDCDSNTSVILVALKDPTTEFLQYLEKINLQINHKIKINEIIAFDQSMELIVNDDFKVHISKNVADKLQVQTIIEK